MEKEIDDYDKNHVFNIPTTKDKIIWGNLSSRFGPRTSERHRLSKSLKDAKPLTGRQRCVIDINELSSPSHHIQKSLKPKVEIIETNRRKRLKEQLKVEQRRTRLLYSSISLSNADISQILIRGKSKYEDSDFAEDEEEQEEIEKDEYGDVDGGILDEEKAKKRRIEREKSKQLQRDKKDLKKKEMELADMIRREHSRRAAEKEKKMNISTKRNENKNSGDHDSSISLQQKSTMGDGKKKENEINYDSSNRVKMSLEEEIEDIEETIKELRTLLQEDRSGMAVANEEEKVMSNNISTYAKLRAVRRWGPGGLGWLKGIGPEDLHREGLERAKEKIEAEHNKKEKEFKKIEMENYDARVQRFGVVRVKREKMKREVMREKEKKGICIGNGGEKDIMFKIVLGSMHKEKEGKKKELELEKERKKEEEERVSKTEEKKKEEEEKEKERVKKMEIEKKRKELDNFLMEREKANLERIMNERKNQLKEKEEREKQEELEVENRKKMLGEKITNPESIVKKKWCKKKKKKKNG